MKKSFLKIFSYILMLSIFVTPQVRAINLDNIPATQETTEDGQKVEDSNSIDLAKNAGYDKDVTAIMMVNRVIKVVLGLSSTAAIILILIAGVKYMTSHGNQADITKSKKMMGMGFVGIAIMATAYVTSNFIIDQIENIVYKDTSSHYVEGEDDGEEEEEWETGGVTAYAEYPACLDKYKKKYCDLDKAIENKQNELNTEKHTLAQLQSQKQQKEEEQRGYPASDQRYITLGTEIKQISQEINKQEKGVEKLEEELEDLENGQKELRNNKKITSKGAKEILGSSVGFKGDATCAEYTEIWETVNSNYCSQNE